MSRPVAVRKALPLAGLAMGALRGLGTAAKVAGKGAKSVAVGAKNLAGKVKDKAIEQGAEKLADKKQLAVGVANLQQQRAQMNQQKQQNQMSTAQDMADRAKADATVQKAFNFFNYLEQEEYEPFMQDVFNRAKNMREHGKLDHYNKRMGKHGVDHEDARYTDDHTFNYKGKDTGLTISQILSALHEIYKEKNPDGRGRLKFTDMITTDDPHPSPADMGHANPKQFQAIVDYHDGNLITAGQTLSKPKGVEETVITPQGFFDRQSIFDMGLPNETNQSNSNKFLQQFYGGGKKNFQNVEDLVNRFSTREEDKLSEQLAAQDKVQEGRDYIAEQQYNKRMQQEEAERQKVAEQEAKERAFQEQPVQVKQIGGMYFVTDPAYDYNQKMMDYQSLIQGGYDKYLKSTPFDLAWQMLFKESVELHHDNELPSEFVNDVMMLDNTHKMTQTNNGTLIDNIDPFMHRTIELMAQNYKEDNPVKEKPQSMLFY